MHFLKPCPSLNLDDFLYKGDNKIWNNGLEYLWSIYVSNFENNNYIFYNKYSDSN